ncbi:MAG: hypothetical protein CML66_28330 [Rhodobacteraceae bacterium]|nr:hypothetical protein [Paracoccaceae bacterium]MAY47775.1 hypothetical protein [Paracoccaceae bacterium]
MKFIHLHIPKTAGTSLRESLAAAHPELVIKGIVDAVPDSVGPEVDVVSGHFSHEDAMRFGDQVVTVLRHPVDRFVSIYYFWRELYEKDIERSRKTTVAHSLSLLEFARAFDEPELCSELYNRMAWQLHSSYRLLRRFEHRRDRGLTDQMLLDETMANLRNFAVVGFQDRYGDFVTALNNRFHLDIENRKINVTQRRSSVEDLSHAEISAILPWVAVDMEIYTTALREFG